MLSKFQQSFGKLAQAMAKVDLQAMSDQLKGLFTSEQMSRTLGQRVRRRMNVRPSRYVKRMWTRAGKPASLRQFAETMAPWDPMVRAWLAGDPWTEGSFLANMVRKGFNEAVRNRAFVRPDGSRPTRPPTKTQRAQMALPIKGHRLGRLIIDEAMDFSKMRGGDVTVIGRYSSHAPNL